MKIKLIPEGFAFLLLLLLSAACEGEPNTEETQEAAKDWTLLPFEKVDSLNPVMTPDPSLTFACPLQRQTLRWAVKDVFNPATVVRGDTLLMIFRAEDSIGRYNGTSRLGLAMSFDGLHFEKFPEPVFFPEEDSMKVYEWEGGNEDPRIVESEDGRYIMTYTAYDGETARLCVAASRDLRNWDKHGLAFGEGKYRDLWSKSGSIVSRRQGNRLVAERIDGQYWMYWGDKNIHLATSDDLLNWTPLTADDSLMVVMPYRPGYFDSDLVEPGPPALLTDQGILLIYNGRNYGPERNPDIPEGTYSAGQALFDAANPQQLLKRTDEPFFRPEADYEIAGQVNRVVFLEGLAPFRDKWFLYYGTADSKIAVAVKSEIGNLR